MQRGIKESTINERYTIIKSFYEKYVELINEKMIENIEQNMTLKFNLQEILEINENHQNNVNLFFIFFYILYYLLQKIIVKLIIYF
jgi:hypothetical protein